MVSDSIVHCFQDPSQFTEQEKQRSRLGKICPFIGFRVLPFIFIFFSFDFVSLFADVRLLVLSKKANCLFVFSYLLLFPLSSLLVPSCKGSVSYVLNH